MTITHNTRDPNFRIPFGAVKCGTKILMSLAASEPGLKVMLRTWVDGEGEKLFPMKEEEGEGLYIYRTELCREDPGIIWYSFIISRTEEDGTEKVFRYGAREGRTGGEGAVYDHEPPSFQITVYRERRLPDWYRKAVFYQIFPDRFSRDDNWEETVKAGLGSHKNGPARVINYDWDKTPSYKKDEKGRVTEWEFYGGTLRGIRDRLPFLKDMGITALYLNPVFESASNHRYDTGDYMHVDPVLGGDEALEELIDAAEKEGISIILDGVFNHTGCDSIYFNRYGNYDSLGAFQSENSSYRSWYTFNDTPAGYNCWWGVEDLPDVNENEESYKRFIYDGDDAVVSHYLKKGIRGWRLDVADELPDEFIEGIKAAALKTKEDSVIIGEVWDDASNKISYGKLRRYLLGSELDGAMNYPLLDAVHSFLLSETNAYDLLETLTSLKENYPSEALYGAFNLMGSHDRARIMTIMGEAPSEGSLSDEEKGSFRLTEERRNLAKSRIWLMTLMQMTLPGVPSLYYGDEAGLEGYRDPWNRGAY
ncbi:MAG: glycoside hydrolase family 13 protein, partial [Lachnospiraceae bacterium]|nr:glycoside hydrolase family 13 protein [Lachnospiraceae bacterium]